MKITDFRQNEIRPTEARLDRPERAPVKRDESRPESSTDKFTMSPLSETLLGELDSTKKVEALKASYEAGTYRVDPESLAKALVKVHMNMSGSSSDRPAVANGNGRAPQSSEVPPAANARADR
jgi:anti-sigma28 factor (negative regulator of flagellin synthesis)